MTSSASQYASEQSWRDLQRKLKSLPEKVRLKQIHNVLAKEAHPLVWAARKAAYQNSLNSNKKGIKKIRKSGSYFLNLYSSIGMWPNKENKDYRYVVVGTRSPRKKSTRRLDDVKVQAYGAIYSQWQNLGGMGPGKGFKPKAYFDRAAQEYGQQVSNKAARAVNKEIEKILAATFR